MARSLLRRGVLEDGIEKFNENEGGGRGLLTGSSVRRGILTGVVEGEGC